MITNSLIYSRGKIINVINPDIDMVIDKVNNSLKLINNTSGFIINNVFLNNNYGYLGGNN